MTPTTVAPDQGTPTSAAQRTPGHPCDAACVNAAGDTHNCICSCGGTQHGAAHRRVYVSTPATRAAAWARIPATDDDRPF